LWPFSNSAVPLFAPSPTLAPPSPKQGGGISGVWFKLHQAANITAALLAIVAAAVIFAGFQWAGRADTSPYYTCEGGCEGGCEGCANVK
jgi:hypothetical protein